MVVQYCIDWDYIAEFAKEPPMQGFVAERLIRLAKQIGRSGFLVKSAFVMARYAECQAEMTKRAPIVSRIVADFEKLYNGCCLNVDGCAKSTSANEVIDNWHEYLLSAGLKPEKNDCRCVHVGRERWGGRPFFLVAEIGKVFEGLERTEVANWGVMQHFGGNDESARKFERYFEAFVASSSDYIRIYDPYLATVLLPLVKWKDKDGRYPDDWEHARARYRIWRNSLCYLSRKMLKNRHLKRIEFITSRTRECQRFLEGAQYGNRLKLGEVIHDIFLPAFNLRHANIEVVFHFLNSDGRFFHDRLVANERICFSIGHGCDICDLDSGYKELCQKEFEHEIIMPQRWGLMPDDCRFRLMSFNVFYGCTSRDVIAINVFKKSEPTYDDSRQVVPGALQSYPQGCTARQYRNAEQLREDFDLGILTGSDCLSVQTRTAQMTIRVNPGAQAGTNGGSDVDF